ncbi:MAG: pyridoxal phosphate-dependent aminotransferase [bacterium]
MPKFPKHSQRVELITGSVFETYAAKMTAQGDNLIKLHIGDTDLLPKYPLPLQPSTAEDYRHFNQYCNTFGLPALREALVEKLRSDNDLQLDLDNVLVTNGATNALSISMMALIDPGDEVLILTPAWPFFFGMVKIAGGKIVEAPTYVQLFENSDFDIEGYLESFVTTSTAAIYVNSPNNPSSKVLNRQQLQQIAHFAQKHDLWVISDEAYDGLTFDERPHVSLASFPEMFERTLSIFTFSKSFMFAGLRLGYVAAAPLVIKSLNKMMVHQLYSPSTLAQQMMVEPVRTRHDWLPGIRSYYQDLRALVVEKLKIDFPIPEGTYFVFFPVDTYLEGRDYWQLIEACLDSGVSVAPGNSFGKDFNHYIRICFTGESPERLELGIEKLNKVLEY